MGTLTELSISKNRPWFLTGDFNDILSKQEKDGGATRAEGTFIDFRTFHLEYDLYDIPHCGDFLYWRGVRGDQVVKCRLDRSIANSAWFELFQAGSVEYLRYRGSDHKPLITCHDVNKRKRRGLLRFDRRLHDNPEVKDLIKETWKSSTCNVQSKITEVRQALVQWNKEQQRNSRQLTEDKTRELDIVISSTTNDVERIRKINEDLKTAYLAEEAYWKQRSRNLWLCLGDKNSGFFHETIKGRRALNNFSVLETDKGTPVFNEAEIAKTIVNYFDKLFTSVEGERIQVVEEALVSTISSNVNEGLIKIHTTAEIHAALMAIHPDKSPGPDGFSASFFQANWSTVGPDIVQEIQLFFTSGFLPRNLNHTHVRLVPKGTGAKTVSDYRLIALCNVYYKIISKLLVGRLNSVLPNLISENHSAFVKGRAISENVPISHEILHFLKTSEASKNCSMAVKTDMSEAYDRLEWDFIEAVLTKLAFHEKWVNLIMQCIRMVTYSFLLNESARGKVTPQRGIRQGDPLSLLSSSSAVRYYQGFQEITT